MSNEIFDPLGVTGQTLYVNLYNADGQVWNTSSSAFEAYATANIGDYDISLTELGTASGVYTADFPSAIVTGGTYHWVSYIQSGGSPAESDTRADTGEVNWTGTASASTPSGAMTGSDFRDYLLRGGFKRDDKDTEIYEAITDAVKELNRRFQFQESQQETLITDSITVDGDFKMDVESDYGMLSGIVVEDDEDAWPLDIISKNKFDKIYPDQNVTSDRGIPEHACLYNNDIYIGPIPDKTDYGYRKTYSKLGGTITSSTTGVPFTAEYRSMLKFFTYKYLYEALEDFERSGYWSQRAEQELNQSMEREEYATGDHVFVQAPDDSYD